MQNKTHWIKQAPVLFLLFLFVLVIFTATIKLRDPDTWWLLATGKQILFHGLFSQNTFSFTHPEYHWPNNYWLISVILRTGEIMGGIYGVQIIPVLFVFALLYFLTDTTLSAREKKNWFLFAILITLALFACRFRFAPRPHLASLLGITILYNLWARQPRRFFLWVGILGFVWANLHVGVIFGAIGFIPLIIGSALQKERDKTKKAALGAVSFVLCSLVNVEFFYPYTYALSHLWKFDALKININELQTPELTQYPLHFLLAALSVLVSWPRIKAKDFTYFALIGMWFIFSLKSLRGIPYFSFAALPGMYASIDELIEKSGKRIKPRWVSYSLIILSFTVTSVLAFNEFQLRKHNYPFGLGVNERLIPSGASDFFENEALPGNFYNAFTNGGYLIWRFFPFRRVFQDGRGNAYPEEFLAEFNAEGFHRTLLSKFDKYNVQFAIVWRQPTFDEGDILALGGWPLVYLDGLNAVFVRPGSLEKSKLARLALYSIPYRGEIKFSGRDRERLHYELNRIDPKRLLSGTDFYRFLVAARSLNDSRLEERFFSEGEKLFPD